ncbi:MAG: hypothetical protein ONB23_03090 [candidate division KSB1 bacterium]|nr:hypothetical protein [candidate division KSB1 bacterium]
MRAPHLILACFLCLWSCAEREFSNPLDPRNPQTRGRPQGLRCYSLEDTVFLFWDRLDLIGLRGCRVWRADEGAGFRVVAVLPPECCSFVDVGLTSGRRYHYFVTIVGEDFESPPSDTATITPGPTTGLVADPYAGSVVRLSYDLQHVIWESSWSAYPYDMVVDRRRGKVWVTDALSGCVWIVSLRTGDYVGRSTGFWSPWSLSPCAASGGVLVADYYGRQVVALDAEGNELWRDDRFRRPADVAAAGVGFWVLDRETRSVAYYSGPGTEALYRCPFSLQDPREIEADAKGLFLWLADAHAVYCFDMRRGKWQLVLDRLVDVRGLSVGPDGEQGWILDGTGVSQWSARALRADRAGMVEVESGGWFGATDIAYDRFTHGCLLANPLTHEVVRLDSLGNVESRSHSFTRPQTVKVD